MAIAIGVTGGTALMGCQLLEDAPPPVPKPVPVKPPPVVDTKEEAEAPEELPPGHYHGIAGLRESEQGACPHRYVVISGLCVHVRLAAMQLEADLKRNIADFRRGVMPPIVADAPAPQKLEPGEMEPGALKGPQRNGEPGPQGVPPPHLAEASAAGAQPQRKGEPVIPGGAPVRQGPGGVWRPGGGGGPNDGSTMADFARVQKMDAQLRLLGQHVDILKGVQELTADGEVTPEELTQLKELLKGAETDVPLDQLLDVFLGAGLAGLHVK